MSRSPLQYVRPNILALAPYSTARDEYEGGAISVWLDANESPYDNGVNRYPDPHQHALKQAVAALKGVSPSQLFLGGAGSDEAIDLLFRIFCTPGRDNVVSIAPTYGVYSVAASTHDVALREVPLGEGFALPTEALLAAADSHTKLLWICSPNNPTGNAFPPAALADLCRRFAGIVVVDEAYVDFSSQGSMLAHLGEHPNLVVLQTFSKAWGMADMRLGMAFAAPEVAALFARVKYPYNVSGVVQREALKRIAGGCDAQVREIVSERGLLAQRLVQMPCVARVFPSEANFFLVEVRGCATALYQYLVRHGVIVRNRSAVPGCANCLRLTIGTPKENRQLLTLLAAYEGDATRC